MFKRYLPLLILLVVGAAVSLGAVLAGTPATNTRVDATPTALILNAAPSLAASPSAAAGTPGPGAGAPTRTIANAAPFRFSGNLVSASQANLGFQTGGRVQELRVKEGDRVKAGAILIVLEAGALQAQMQQAQAAYDLAKAGFDKVKKGPTVDDVTVAKTAVDRAKADLDQAQAAYDRIGGAANSFIAMTPQSAALQSATSAYRSAVAQYQLTIGHPTDTELRQAQAQLDQAQAALNLAKQNLSNAALTAPIDGTVIMLGPKLGEMVAPGTPVATVADLSRMQVQVSVDENSLAGVKLDQPVILTLDALGGQSLAGHVSRIAQSGSTNGGIVSVPVTIDVDSTSAPIYPGLSATVQFGRGDQ